VTSGTTTVRAATHELFGRWGVRVIFGNPGSTELPLFRDLPDEIRYVMGLQESVAVSMADGYAQATDRPAVVSLHSFAGLGHGMAAIATAFKNRTPLLLVSGQQSRSLLAGEPYLRNDDPARLASPYVKGAVEPASPEDVPTALLQAWNLAMLPPRGPALVSVPADDWERPCGVPDPAETTTTMSADPSDLTRLAARVARASNPAFIAGAAVDVEDCHDALVAAAELHEARVYGPPMSYRCGFSEQHRLFAGFLPPMRQGIADALTGHDLVVVFGAPAFSYHVAGEGPVLREGTDLVVVTDAADRAARVPRGTAVLSSMRPPLLAIGAAPPTVERAPVGARPRPDRVETDDGIITPELLVQTLDDVRTERMVIVEEAPSTRPVMCDRLPNHGRRTFFTTGGGAMGYALPAAVGQAMARPKDDVVAFVGDGAVLYSVQALWTAARHRVDVAVVVVNNRAYATVDRFADRFGIDRLRDSDLGGVSFVDVARGLGVRAEQVDHADELADALRRTVGVRTGPRLLEVTVRE